LRELKVISLGDLVADVMVSIPRLPVEASVHQIASQVSFEPGGACNFLIAGARLGLHMQALGVVGEDLFGKATLEALEAEGVDVSNVLRPPGNDTTTVIVLVDGQGQNVFLGHYGQGPRAVMPESWRAALAAADAVCAFGYTLQEERFIHVMMEGLTYAQQQGRKVFFDPGPFTATATPQQVAAVLKTCHGVLLTEDEIPSLTGGAGGLAAARSLLNDTLQVVCIKRGEQGCVLLTAQQEVSHPGYPVEVADITAAGDSFYAAFLVGYLQDWPLARVAAFANAMGAAKVRKFGSGRQVPTATEVRQLLKEFNTEIQF
jgi:sugar/nucleoside kinase (ribokinase family)